MRRLTALALLTTLAFAAPAAAESSQSVTVVEVFSSQGCAASADVQDEMRALAAAPGVLLLTFPVDHWDYLGWRDPLARSEYSARHRAYAARLSPAAISTPQLVVNGERLTTASTRTVSPSRPAGVRMSVSKSGDQAIVRLAEGPRVAPPRQVWLVSYNPALRQTRIQAGENAGMMMTEPNVVVGMTLLGQWAGGPAALQGACAPACVALVQDAEGVVLGAVKAAPEPIRQASR